MAEEAAHLQQRLKLASYLLVVGLLIIVVTLDWTSPLSFILFIGGGGALVGLGVIVYLIAIVSK